MVEHFTSGWEIVKPNLVPWLLTGLVLMMLMSLGVGMFLLPNFYRVTRKAIDNNAPPDVGGLFEFDNIADDIIAMLLYSVAITVGLFVCVVGALVTGVLFFWVPMIAAEGHYAPMDMMKASLAHAKANFVPILVFLIVASLINNIAASLCMLPVLLSAPVTLVAAWRAYESNRDAIHQAAREQGIPLKGQAA